MTPSTVRIGAIEMAWDSATRVAHLRFLSETAATGTDARTLVEALSAWTAADPAPFALLGDGANLKSVDAEYRATWSAFLRQHRDRCRLAFFNMNPFIRIAAEMFRLGTGLKVKAFADERDARRWLREQGIAA